MQPCVHESMPHNARAHAHHLTMGMASAAKATSATSIRTICMLLCWSLILQVVVGFNIQPPTAMQNAPSKHRRAVAAAAATDHADTDGNSKISMDALAGRNVLVVGGSGRVGGSVVTQLVQHDSRVTVGGTSVDSFQAAKARNTAWKDDNVNFQTVNKEDALSITSVLKSGTYDIVVHTAGPFQGKATATNGVLQACIENTVPYVDVCDDYCTAMAAKSKYASDAQANNVPCIISTGCWVRSCDKNVLAVLVRGD